MMTQPRRTYTPKEVEHVRSSRDGVDVDLTMVQVEVGTLKLVGAVVDAQVQALGQVSDVGWLP